MTDKNDFLSDRDLEAMLGKLEHNVPAPSDDLMARILADAEDLRVVPGAQVAPAPEGIIDTILSILGGWKGAGGLVTAGVIGIWIGVSPPSSIETTTADLWDLVSPDLTGGWSEFDDIL